MRSMRMPGPPANQPPASPDCRPFRKRRKLATRRIPSPKALAADPHSNSEETASARACNAHFFIFLRNRALHTCGFAPLPVFLSFLKPPSPPKVPPRPPSTGHFAFPDVNHYPHTTCNQRSIRCGRQEAPLLFNEVQRSKLPPASAVRPPRPTAGLLPTAQAGASRAESTELLLK